MTDAEQIKRLRAMVTRLSDALADRTMHSGLLWRDTPMAKSAAKLLTETDPDGDGGQRQLDESPFPAPDPVVGYPLPPGEQAHVDRVVAANEAR